MKLNELKNEPYRALLRSFLSFLKNQGYRDSTITNFRKELTQIDKYMEDKGIEKYASYVGMDYYIKDVCKRDLGKNRMDAIRAHIVRFNDYVEGSKSILLHKGKTDEMTLPESFTIAVQHFIGHCKQNGNKDNTISAKYRFLSLFLIHCYELGACRIEELTVPVITTACNRMNNKDSWAVIRKFLKHLCLNDFLQSDLAVLVPHYRRPYNIPSSYSEGEIQELEKVIDRSTTTGIRDYAMILLATRLGMRAGDIAGLELASLDFDHDTIQFAQQKGHKMMTLTMLPDVKNALLSYIKKVHHKSDSKKVFVRLRAPHSPITTSAVRFAVSKYFGKAGINVENKHHGPHALRASLANSMINDGIPYDAVRNIMGHTDPNAIKHYAKLDIHHLRSCAIKPPPAEGIFKAFLEGGVKI